MPSCYVLASFSVVSELSHTWKSKEWIRLGSHTDADRCSVWLIVYLAFPIVDFILFWHGQIAHDSALRVKEFNLCSGFHKTVCNLKLWLKLPG